jgi:anti-sigma-K factor RskA
MFEHDFLQLVPLSAAGALSGEDKEAFERHMAQGCEICEAELRIYQETAAMLPFALSNRPLPKGLKAKISTRIELEAPRQKRFDWNRTLSLAAAIAFFALAASIVWWQDHELKLKQGEISELTTALKQQKQEIAWLRDPSVQLALLTGLQPAPGAKGKMLWNPSQSKGIFYANWLPALPPGKSYQLWVIGKGGPVSAGVFDPNAGGSAVVTVSDVAFRGGALQFAVTIEPRGGLPKPSGEMVLAGKPL